MQKNNITTIFYIITCISTFCMAIGVAGERDVSNIDKIRGEHAVRLVDAMRLQTSAAYNEISKAVSADGYLNLEQLEGSLLIRKIAMTANNILELDMDTEKAKDIVRLVLLYQDKNPDSPGFGSFIWGVNPESYDRNAVHFIMLPLTRMVSGYGNVLGDEFLEEITPSLQAALECIKLSNFSVEYTNIYTKRISNLLLLGQFLNDTDAVEIAEHCIDNWLNYVANYGVSEYTNPTYTPLTIYCLSTAHRYAENSQIKKKLENGIRFIWSSMAANTFAAAGGRLCGSFSRVYDSVYGQGSVITDLYLAGLTDIEPKYGLTFMSDTRAASNYVSGGFAPDNKILDLANIYPRIVKEKFGARYGQDRYVYVTEDYAIGSSSYFYCNYDRQINVSLKSDKYLPQITLVVDSCYHPYERHLTTSGRNFAINNSIAAVQEENLMLAVLRIEPHKTNLQFERIASNFIIPAMADGIYLNGKKIQTDKPFEIDTDLGDAISISEGKSLVNFKFLTVEGYVDFEPNFQIVYDGNKLGVARFTAQHYQGKKTKITDPFYLAVMIETAKCEDEMQIDNSITAFIQAQADVIETNDTFAVKISLNGVGLESEIGKDFGAVIRRQINGSDYVPQTLSINDIDYAKLYLDDYIDMDGLGCEPVAHGKKIVLGNLGFEEGFKGWSRRHDPDSFFSIERASAWEGNYGLRLNNLSEHKPCRLLSQLIPCEYGKKYELRFNYKLLKSNNARSGATVELEFLNKDGQGLSTRHLKHPEWYRVVLTPKEGWQQESIRAKTLQDAKTMRIAIYSDRHSISVADFDSFELTEIE